MAADKRRVQIRLPSDIFGGSPEGFLDHLGLEGHHVADDRWSVKARDLQGENLLTVYNIADESGRAHRFDLLHHVPNAEPIIDAETISRANEVRQRLLERATGAGDIVAMFHLIQLNIIMASRSDLNSVVEDAYAGIGSMPLESTGEPAFVNRSAHLVRVSDTLVRRVRLPGMMFRFDQDPDAITTLRSVREGRSRPTEQYFGSSADWYANIIGMSHYIGPLLGCVTPRLWAFQSNRQLSVILLSLGMSINGFRAEPAEVMQLLPVFGPSDRSTSPLQLDQTSCAEAVEWWVMRLNQMFGYLSDPTTFKDANGEYAAHEHHHWMLTFGQIFALATSLQCAGRDVTAQRALMNDLLGAFTDRIMPIGAEFELLCTLSYAKKKAAAVRAAMPAAAAALLMPGIDRAIDALAYVQNTFFMQRQRGDENVRLRLPDGRIEELPPERAAARLLKLYRNATHGFGHRRGARKKNEIDASLLAHHDGDLPRDIVLLPYLYLLDTLCNPERVRQDIERKVAMPD